MRAFLAATPDPTTCSAIDAWRTRCWPVIHRAVPVQNYHITLAFLGEISPEQLEKLTVWLQGFVVTPFELQLDEVGYWPDSRCLWLGPTGKHAALSELASVCASTANRIRIRVSKRSYSPHLTLARSIQIPPAAALIAPAFNTTISSLQLYQSLRSRSGVRYVELHSS